MASLSRDKTFPAWKKDSSFRRAQWCVTMLNVYGILSDLVKCPVHSTRVLPQNESKETP